MRGIRRKIGLRNTGKLPATADIIGQMMAACPDTTIGLRDAALLGIDFAALRRSELVAIEVADVKFVDDGLRLLIPRSKTDQTGEVARGRGDPRREDPLCRRPQGMAGARGPYSGR